MNMNMKLQRRRTIDGELVVGWLNAFNVISKLSPRRKRKIFLVGLPKTGTTSVSYCLQKAGVRTEHFPYLLVNYLDGELVLNERDLENYDAASDLPVTASLSTLKELHPDAYFICTYRDKQRWLHSCRRHPWPLEILLHADLVGSVSCLSAHGSVFRSMMNNIDKLRLMHERVLGSAVFVEEVFAAHYDMHVAQVQQLLGGCDNYLPLNVADGVDAKEKLGELLGLDLQGPFERKDCFYTWFFKKITQIAGWERINRIRAEYRDLYLRGLMPESRRGLPVGR